MPSKQKLGVRVPPGALNEELVVLVDDNDNQIGTCPKVLVHHANTPLHRAFSSYIFNQWGEVLVQRRAKSKKTWGGYWSNSCCGHPTVGEERVDAAKRRIKEELGIGVYDLKQVAPYKYRFGLDGVVEHEICPIFVAQTKDEVKPNPAEVEECLWLSWPDFKAHIEANKDNYSPWCKEQVGVLEELGITLGTKWITDIAFRQKWLKI